MASQRIVSIAEEFGGFPTKLGGRGGVDLFRCLYNKHSIIFGSILGSPYFGKLPFQEGVLVEDSTQVPLRSC